MENRSRRKNLRIFGLREGAEGIRPLIHFIQDMLPKWLELRADQSPILERVHRTLAPTKTEPKQSCSRSIPEVPGSEGHISPVKREKYHI
ncbi:hypothetical protein LDENG_00263900 [Lucifuga dentata]|nr:hypothetical protein LDENG_00263900 [Lucifuga dentata]